MATDKERLKEQAALLPYSPGVYQFLDRSGKIIYVGKAKSLRKRVSSYFVESREHSPKVRVMVRQIAEIRHIVVGSETDALLLENSLIKSLQPRYNILLKDDKTYPWIVVRRERFPRVQSTRQLVRDGSRYFGPYGSVMMQRSVLEFVREVVPLRTCKLDLSPEKIARGRYGVCLQYHIGNCKGPCIGAQSEQEYERQVELVASVLRGDLRPVRRYLEGEMTRAAEALRFEAAQRYKQRLDALDNYASRSVIVSAKIVDADVFSLLRDDEVAWCNFVKIRHGSVVGVVTVRLSAGVGATESDMLTLAIQHLVEQAGDGKPAREAIVPFLPSTTLLFEGVTFTVPKRGEKLELLEFSQKSARIYRAAPL
ncbi:MAG: excinuclease ABC subunit UvrC, partial [Alistipes sp.]|nr:excinuclease ABC subunit UvrC [Alistipes sp.]